MKMHVTNLCFGLATLVAYGLIQYMNIRSGGAEQGVWTNKLVTYALPGLVPAGFFIIYYRHSKLVMYSLLMTGLLSCVWLFLGISIVMTLHLELGSRM
jgi:hypothetical protein